MDVVRKEPQEPEREDPTELARPSGVVTTGTTGASAETESGTEGGDEPQTKCNIIAEWMVSAAVGDESIHPSFDEA